MEIEWEENIEWGRVAALATEVRAVWGDASGDGLGSVAPYANRSSPNTKPSGRGATSKITLVFCETPRSVEKKLSYANDNGMQGFRLWTLSQMVNASGS